MISFKVFFVLFYRELDFVICVKPLSYPYAGFQRVSR